MTPYDEVAYPSSVQSQTHPDRLATIAALRGLDPAAPARCRYLELGCGDGANLVSLALGAPDSEFVGVDLAERAVTSANGLAAEVDVTNVRALVGDVARPDPAWGMFDFVVAHGVYSWIPAEVRDGMMAAIKALLRPDGIGYVSYAAYPGCYARHMFRNVLRLHTRAIPGGDEKAREGHNLLRFLAAARTRRGDPWEDWLRSELEDHLEYPAGFLRHDDLADVNEPVWWHEFLGHAARHGLRCVGEADWSEDSDAGFPPEVRSMLSKIPDDATREQYRDLLKFRRFRQTLLAHVDRVLSAAPRLDRIARMQVVAPMTLEGDASPLDRKELETYVGPRGSRATTDSRIGRAALRILSERGPRPIPFGELHETAAAQVALACGGVCPPEEGAETLLELVASFHDAGFAKLHSHVAPYAATAGARPVASPFARAMARRGRRVVTLLQNTLELQDERSRTLLTLLDGTRDRAAVLAAMRAAESPPNPPPPTESVALTAQVLETSLQRMAALGLLSA